MAKWKIDRKLTEIWGVSVPHNFNGGSPKFWTKFLKLHISDLLSHKGCPLVERPRTFGGKRTKSKKETSVERYNSSIHTTCGQRYNYRPHTVNCWTICEYDKIPRMCSGHFRNVINSYLTGPFSMGFPNVMKIHQ